MTRTTQTLTITAVLLGLFLVTGCATSTQQPTALSEITNESVLLEQIAKLTRQQAETTAVLEKLQQQVLDNQYAAEKAIATADAAQQMAAASDDRVESVSQTTQFK